MSKRTTYRNDDLDLNVTIIEEGGEARFVIDGENDHDLVSDDVILSLAQGEKPEGWEWKACQETIRRVA